MLAKWRHGNRLIWILLLLGIVLILFLFLASAFGAVTISLPNILKMTLNKLTVFAPKP